MSAPAPPALVAPAGPELFQAMAEPRRRQLLEALVSGVQEVGDLSRRCDMPRTLVTHHLGVLRRAGLVQFQRRHAVVRPECLETLRRYFDLALTAAAISTLPR